jgi:hypothetical protein
MGECLCVKTKPLPFEELGVDIERGRNMSHGVPPLISAGIIVGSYHRDIFVAQRAVKARSRRPYGEAPTNFPRRLKWLVGLKFPAGHPQIPKRSIWPNESSSEVCPSPLPYDLGPRAWQCGPPSSG